jgi:hypothetical protein
MNSQKAVPIISTFLILSLIGFGSVEYAAGETISGYVHDIHGAGIDNVWVVAFRIGGSGCGSWHNGISTDTNGNYSLEVTAGTYYISADASHHISQNYIDEWWTSGSGTRKCAEAEGVSVSSSNVPNIDFSLDARRGMHWMLLLFDD